MKRRKANHAGHVGSPFIGPKPTGHFGSKHMTTHTLALAHAHRQEAQALMQRALLRMAGIAALIVLFALVDCAALLAGAQRPAPLAAADARTAPAQAAAASDTGRTGRFAPA